MNAKNPLSKALRPCGAVLACTTVLLMAACTGQDPTNEFPPEGQVHRNVQNFIDAQGIAAARAQAMLHTADFSDDHLSALGRTHIDMMLKALESHPPLKVYLDVADDDHAQARQQAVGDYLLSKGLKQSQFALSMGPNPDALAPAADNLLGLQKLNSADSSAAGNSSSGSAASGAEAPSAPTMGGSN